MCTTTEHALLDHLQERASGIVTLRDEDPLMIGQLVNSFYGCDYDSPGDELVEFATEFHAGMYAVGDQYAAEPLKDLARYKISENLKEGSQPLDRWVVRGATETSLASSKLSTLQLCQAIEAYETALSLG